MTDYTPLRHTWCLVPKQGQTWVKLNLVAVLLIALVTIGAILLGLLIVCVVLTCLKRSSQRACGTGTGFLRYRSPTHTLDKRAMIQDSSSEGSAADHGPVSYLTPTHQASNTFPDNKRYTLMLADKLSEEIIHCI